jgi:hypothetical protein
MALIATYPRACVHCAEIIRTGDAFVWRWEPSPTGWEGRSYHRECYPGGVV